MGDLNRLIKSLREEVAIAGGKGATVKDILEGIEEFYRRKTESQVGHETHLPLQNVDRAFQERVWSWLVKDRYIKVGKDGEGSSLSLDEIEAQGDPLRLFTTEQQIWTTLTGHEKDSRKVPAKSFELLEIIAAHKEKGITQPELVRITGQDKRSVPQRTQKLADAGHVKKIPVLANHSNTSLLIHTRFVKDFAAPAAGEQITASLNTKAAPERLFLGHNKFVRAEKQIRDAIDVLGKENGLLMWHDLKRKIVNQTHQVIKQADCMQDIKDPRTSRLLAEAIRKLEDLGVTARVRATASSDSNATNNALHRCIQLLRPPTENEWRILFEWTKQEQSKFSEAMVQDDDSQADLMDTEPNQSDNIDEALGQPPMSTESAEDLHVPTWNPNRALPHTIRAALLAAGTIGLSTKDLKRVVTGPFYQRPIDRFLDRCVWRWQMSQPSHLRYLAIVRDSAQFGKTSFYVHFVYDAFGIKVENQETIWEAVQSLPNIEETVAYDSYGFGSVPLSAFAGNNNDLTLKKALEIAGDTRHEVDLTQETVRLKSVMAKTGENRAKHEHSKRRTSSTKNAQSDAALAAGSIGRPRKYPTAGTALDLSRMTADEVRKVLTSQQRAQEYLRKKARKQVEEHVAAGISIEQAEAAVLSELGLSAATYAGNTIKVSSPPTPQKASSTKKRKRGASDARYLPSILAHTIPLLQISALSEHPHKKRKQAGKSRKVQILNPNQLGYFPSVLAHSQPFTHVSTFQNKPRAIKRKQKVVNIGDEDAAAKTAVTALSAEVPHKSMQAPISGTSAVSLTQAESTIEDELTVEYQIEPSAKPVDKQSNLFDTLAAANSNAIGPGVSPDVKRRKKSHSVRTVPFGGTIAAMRKLIILGIVRNCGGTFPGDGELAYPFLTAYVKKFPEAKPDNKTIKVAKTTLIGEGLLKQIFFTCRSPSGLVQSKSIIALPEIPDSDPRIKALQESMAKCHPHPYFPLGTNIKPELIPRAASYNVGGSDFFRLGTYSNQLPVVADVVVRQFARKGHEQVVNKVSGSNVAIAGIEQSREAVESRPTSTSKSETGRKFSHKKSNNVETSSVEQDQQPVDNPTFTTSKPKSKARKRIAETPPDGASKRRRQKSAIDETSVTSTQQKNRSRMKIVRDVSQVSPRAELDQNSTAVSTQFPFQQLDQSTVASLAPGSSLMATPLYPQDQDATAWERFSSVTDNVVRWETNTPEAFSEGSRNVFVHYPFPKDHHESVPVHSNPVGRKVVDKPITETRHKNEAGRRPAKAFERPTKKRPRATSEEQDTDNHGDSRKRQVTSRPSALEALARKGEKTPGVHYSKGKSSGPKPVETRRARYPWEPEDDRRLLIASILGHIALGGVREENLWGIISRMLDHRYDREMCRRRWNSVRNKYLGDIEVIASELRTALLNAYERDEVPKLDFANFWENDWIGLLAWAMNKIDSPEIEEIELPTSRNAFEAMYLTQDFAGHEGPDFLESKRIASGPVRNLVLNSGTRVVQDTLKEGIPNLEVAKTYIRASILTTQESYDAQKTKEKLGHFTESTIEDAINELQTDRVISQTTRGRATPGRGYDISASFIKALQFKLSVSHFKYASAFKEILDEKFRTEGRIEYKSAFGDGDMITLLNLLADDKIRIEGENIPDSKFGLTKDGYKTRSMDKKIFNFDIFAKPTTTYSYGLPCLPLPSPPLKILNFTTEASEKSCIPLWIDINGNLLSIMWDLALAAVATILVVHTAADASEIAERLQPCLAGFEVRMIMEWLVDAKVAEWKDSKHDVLELKTYWWSVITTPIAKGGSTDEAVMIAGVPVQ